MSRLGYIRAVPKHPPHLKVQRAKVIVTDAGVKRLTECESCAEEKYMVKPFVMNAKHTAVRFG